MKRFSGRGANRVEGVALNPPKADEAGDDDDETVDIERTEENVECLQCGKRFGAKSRLELHVKTMHSERRPQIPCPVSGCQRNFFTKQSLRNHMKSVHHLVDDSVSAASKKGTLIPKAIHSDEMLLQSHSDTRLKAVKSHPQLSAESSPAPQPETEAGFSVPQRTATAADVAQFMLPHPHNQLFVSNEENQHPQQNPHHGQMIPFDQQHQQQPQHQQVQPVEHVTQHLEFYHQYAANFANINSMYHRN